MALLPGIAHCAVVKLLVVVRDRGDGPGGRGVVGGLDRHLPLLLELFHWNCFLDYGHLLHVGVTGLLLLLGLRLVLFVGLG